MFLFIFVISLIPPHFCQLALASTSFISESFTSPRKVSALAKGLNVRDTRSRTLFTKYSDVKPSLRFNASAMESEIAAIFKEFAYGSSTSSSSTLHSSSLTTPHPIASSETSFINYFRNGVTESNVFIGKQREVYTEIKVTSEKQLPDFSESVSSTNDYSALQDGSAYTYVINSYNKNITNSNNNDKARPVVNSYPSFDIDEDDVNEVQVRVTSALKKRGYEAIELEIGKAWIFHVYLTGILFAIVAIACLLSLSRISTCSQLLPRGYFITLHLMIFLASFLRCLLFLHDPYGAYGRLPSVLTSLLFNSVDPCLTTAYSVVLLVLLRAARIRLVPLNMQSPLVLATVCGIHIGGSVVIDVSSGVLEDQNAINTLNITTQAITAIWGAILCLGYVISFSGIEKAAYRQQNDLIRLTFNRKTTDQNFGNKSSAKPSLIYAARLFLICTLLHGLLIAFIILNLVTTKVPISATSSEAWAWWTQTSLERIVEIVLCVLLLATALVLTQSKPRNVQKEKEEKIFSIFSNCGRGTKGIKNIDVYPVANEKCNILENGTLRHSSLNSSMSIAKNGWKHIDDPNVGHHVLKNQMVLNTIDSEYKKALQQDCTYNSSLMFSPLHIVHNNSTLRPVNLYNDNFGNIVEETHQNLSTEQRTNYPHLNNCSKTLPGNNYYCSQRSNASTKEISQSIKCGTMRGCQYPNTNKIERPVYGIYNAERIAHQYAPSPIHYNRSEHDYEVASYYTHSSASNSSHVYTKPYSYYPSTNVHFANIQQCVPHKYKSYNRNYETEPKSEMSVCSSSQSEIHVDYLTDASSSNDGLSNTLSRSLTLPLYSQNCPASMIRDRTNGEANPDHTPDSAVGLDYSSLVEGDLITPENYKIKYSDGTEGTSASGFPRLSTSAFNDVLKNQSGILGKFVTGGCHDINYSPLSLEETISSPSSEYTIIKKSISTGELTDSPNSPTEPHHVCANSLSNDFGNNLSKVPTLTNPVTSI